MFGKRPDGRLIRTLDPLQMITPYIMKTRTDSMNAYEDTFPCEPMDLYIKQKEEEGLKIGYMHILIAAVVRLIALRPQLNRFIMRNRIYARPKIWVSFVVHPTLADGSTETVIKLCFDGTETIQEIATTINEAVRKETVLRKEENSMDKLARLLTCVPSCIIRFAVNTLMWMDRHNILPKIVLNLSPFHTTIFLTNLKSLGINHVHHHVYEFGTTGLFLAFGKEKVIPVVRAGETVHEKHLGYSLVSDERFCDGLYFALSLRQLRKILRNPAILETALDKKVEDIR